MKDLFFNSPVGVRDIYNSECAAKLATERLLTEKLHQSGYESIQTPTFEYFDVFSEERGTVKAKNMYKFFDREGNTLVLRPDITPSIARCVAKYYRDVTTPIRLCYCGNTFINSSEYQGKPKEVTTVGAELINYPGAEADAEILTLTIECMLASGLKQFRVEVGETSFFKAIVKEAGFSADETEALKDLIEEKNIFGLEDFLERNGIGGNLGKIFLNIPQLFGSVECLKEFRELTSNSVATSALDRLEQIYDILKKKGYEKYISYDLGMLSMYGYYTGIIFNAYTYGVGDAIISGGRYDKLVAQFGKDAPAVGMGIVTDRLMLALERNREGIAEAAKVNKEGKRYITIALAKGRLATQTMDILAKVGITCPEINDKNSRKLIFTNEELGYRFFLAKASDVPTYVEYGAADIGIVGKDTIIEEGRKLYEVMDLNLGKCRMCVAGPASARNLLEHGELIRVATKYPAIARDYFTNIKHQTVEIIKLNGSIELAPIVGLSEVIVDIVETGSTLRENGLEVLEEVCPLSARMVVNRVSMKMEQERIGKLIEGLKECKDENC